MSPEFYAIIGIARLEGFMEGIRDAIGGKAA